MSKPLIIMDHDGGVDDYLALMLLTTFDLPIEGVTVTPADCYIDPAVSATRKILNWVGKDLIPVSRGTVRGVHRRLRARKRVHRAERPHRPACPVRGAGAPEGRR